jgi:hypothetical protein
MFSLFKLPSETPKWFYGGLLIIGAILAALWLFPEGRGWFWGILARPKLWGSEAVSVPNGCSTVEIRFPKNEPDVEAIRLLVFNTIDEVATCNPVRTNVNGVIDLKNKGRETILTSKLMKRATLIALPSRYVDGNLIGFRCDKPNGAIYFASWGSVVPSKMEPAKRIDAEASELLEVLCKSYGPITSK